MGAGAGGQFIHVRLLLGHRRGWHHGLAGTFLLPLSHHCQCNQRLRWRRCDRWRRTSCRHESLRRAGYPAEQLEHHDAGDLCLRSEHRLDQSEARSAWCAERDCGQCLPSARNGLRAKHRLDQLWQRPSRERAALLEHERDGLRREHRLQGRSDGLRVCSKRGLDQLRLGITIRSKSSAAESADASV